MTLPSIETQADPLALPGVIRILLGPTASRVLSESGEQSSVVVGRGSYPSDPSRWVIYLKPCSLEVANAACSILAETHTATRIKTASCAIAKPANAFAPVIESGRRQDTAAGTSTRSDRLKIGRKIAPLCTGENHAMIFLDERFVAQFPHPSQQHNGRNQK
jgi:hypothetical protein